MKTKALELAKIWSTDEYISEEDRNELKTLIESNDSDEITDRFYQNLEFGTGGLRSLIGVGSNRINKYNVRRATQAMANTVLNSNFKSPSAAVSMDNRNYSDEFSKEVACCFAANGIKTYIFEELTPTPILSYAVRYFKSSCGVMITASHNPKAYNGFKAYWNDGAQVTPPQDQIIIDEYGTLNSWDMIKIMSWDEGIKSGMIEIIKPEVLESFYNIIEDITINPKMCKEHGDKVHIMYTPLHGCGYTTCMEISKRLGFSKFESVESQAIADGNFTTIKSTPNPEDPIALEMVVSMMLESNADVAFGTDPDCDRLGVVVNQKGIPKYLNGNQIALLMIDYIFSQKKEKGTLPENPLVIKSIVTSPMQKTIVENFDGTVLDTLTGFKWMAKLWRELEEQNTKYNFVYASEESFGYMPHDQVRDKDAVASVALMNEITLFHKLEGKTLVDALDSLYEQYGYAEESLIALDFAGITGKEKIQNIMEYFRSNYKAPIAENNIKIFKDFSSLEEKNLFTKTSVKIEMTSSNVLGFEFENGNVLFVRPSGTEPKIKFYTMVQVKDGDLKSKKSTAKFQINKIESSLHSIVEGL